MKITSAEFVKSAFERRHWVDDGRPEIAFLGRSNVGKSSLLNSLLQRKGLARTSNTPGRTQSINFFLVNGRPEGAESYALTDVRASAKRGFYFVDLPGYGYARVSKATRSDWGKMAEDYLTDRRELVLSIQLVDSRHEPTELDLQLNEWLVVHEMNHIIVATKSDKLSNNQLQKSIKQIQSAMPQSKILAYSSSTGKGRDALWDEIERALKNFEK